MERLRETFGGEDMLILLITVTAPWVYTYAKTITPYNRRVCGLLCVSYISAIWVSASWNTHVEALHPDVVVPGLCGRCSESDDVMRVGARTGAVPIGDTRELTPSPPPSPARIHRGQALCTRRQKAALSAKQEESSAGEGLAGT